MGKLTLVLGIAAMGVASLTACEPVPEGIWDGPVYEVERFDDITYATVFDEHGELQDQKLDLYVPANDTRTKRPVFIWAHGGSFTAGDKSSMRWIPEAMAARGYLVASINYRLREDMPSVRFPLNTEELIAIIEAKEDMQGAVRYFRDLAGFFKVDPTRISVGGYSAGAVMALITATTPDIPGGSGHPNVSSEVCTAVSVSGAGTDLFIDPDDAGALFLHGSSDTIVPYAQGVATYDAMVGHGLTAQLVTYDGTGHAVPGEHPDEMIDEMTIWLKEQMVARIGGCL